MTNVFQARFQRSGESPMFCLKENGEGTVSYRLVNLTSVVDGLLESILRDSIYLHLKENGLMRESAWL